MKQLLKNILIPTLTSPPLSAICSRFFGVGIPIFMLHRMVDDHLAKGGAHTPTYLRRCLRFLKSNGHSFVSIEDIIECLRNDKPLPPKAVAFTVDDGFEDQARLTAPIFIEFNCPATIFLVTGMVDEQLWPWFSKIEYVIEQTRLQTIEIEFPSTTMEFKLDTPIKRSAATTCIQEKIKTMQWSNVNKLIDTISHAARVDIPAKPPKKYRALTWEQARNLEKNGIRFGPHTISHPILSKIDHTHLEEEIAGSWQRLKEEMSSPCNVFCYPNGTPSDFGRREVNLIKTHGFLGALSTIPNYVPVSNKSTYDIYSLPRYGLPDSFHDFMQYSTWIERAKQRVR